MRRGGAKSVRADGLAVVLSVVLAILFIGVSAESAAAQRRRPSADVWEVGMDIGASNFTATDVDPLGTRFSLFTSRAITGSLGVTFDITCTNGIEQFPAFDAEADFTICTGSLGGQFNLPGTHRVWPYVRLAAGQAQLDRIAAENEFDIDDRSLSLQAAVGSRFFLRPDAKVAMRVEAQWLRSTLAKREFRNLSFGVGVTYFPD
jgi:Outer membrane protein beta-barrel domain